MHIAHCTICNVLVSAYLTSAPSEHITSLHVTPTVCVWGCRACMWAVQIGTNSCIQHSQCCTLHTLCSVLTTSIWCECLGQRTRAQRLLIFNRSDRPGRRPNCMAGYVERVRNWHNYLSHFSAGDNSAFISSGNYAINVRCQFDNFVYRK